MSAHLLIRGLAKTFVRHDRAGLELRVLRGVDLELQPGTFTVIRGPSGSGKSSLLRCIFGSYLPTAGQLELTVGPTTLDLAAISERQLLAARAELMAMVSQFLQVIPRVTAVDLVRAEGVSAEEATALLLGLGLDEGLLEVPPASFSGGERQIVNLAISLARPRPLLLLDEATASLDLGRRSRALEFLKGRKDTGVTMLAVFHELPAEPGLIDRVFEMNEGRLAA